MSRRTGDHVNEIEVWTTIAVTQLPAGWRNVYADTNGSGQRWVHPCPALLLQELRTIGRIGPHGHVFDEPCDTPYETRTVFADHDPGEPTLQPADAANYLGTVGPGVDPAELDDVYAIEMEYREAA